MAVNVFLFDPAEWKPYLAGYADGKRFTVEEWSKRLDADLIFNLTTFATKGKTEGQPDTEIIINGNRLCWGKESVSDFVQVNPTDKARGYANAIKDGVVKLSYKFGGSSYRNGIGLTNKGHLIVAQTTSGYTELAFAQAVNKYVLDHKQTVKIFVLEDGGGSVQEYSRFSKLYFHATAEKRKVPTVLCIKRTAPITFTAPIYPKNPSKEQKALYQTLVGGLAADGDIGTLSTKRTKLMQAGFGFDPSLQLGVASALTFTKMGVGYKF